MQSCTSSLGPDVRAADCALGAMALEVCLFGSLKSEEVQIGSNSVKFGDISTDFRCLSEPKMEPKMTKNGFRKSSAQRLRGSARLPDDLTGSQSRALPLPPWRNVKWLTKDHQKRIEIM